MRRLFSSLLAILSCTICVYSQNSGNALKFKDTVIDFGQVLMSDGPVSCTFEGTNVSASDISILSVSTSCGCTNVKWSHDTIKPGGKALITATYTNDEGPYPFDKTITVKIAGQTRPVILHMRGISQKELKADKDIYTNVFGGAIGLESTDLKCGNLEQGGVRSEQFTVANLSGKSVRLTFTDVTDGLKVESRPETIPAGAHATVYYTVSARKGVWGYNHYEATPVINGVSSGKSFRVKAFTADSFSGLTREQKAQGSRPVFEESTFSFGHKKQGAKINAVFTFTNKGRQDFIVYKADSDFAGAAVSAIPQVAPDKEGKFTVSLDTAGMPKGEALVTITLTTNSPLRPIVTLFLAGIID